MTEGLRLLEQPANEVVVVDDARQCLGFAASPAKQLREYLQGSSKWASLFVRQAPTLGRVLY